jgi:hypothetical protein
MKEEDKPKRLLKSDYTKEELKEFPDAPYQDE